MSISRPSSNCLALSSGNKTTKLTIHWHWWSISDRTLKLIDVTNGTFSIFGTTWTKTSTVTLYFAAWSQTVFSHTKNLTFTELRFVVSDAMWYYFISLLIETNGSISDIRHLRAHKNIPAFWPRRSKNMLLLSKQLQFFSAKQAKRWWNEQLNSAYFA